MNFQESMQDLVTLAVEDARDDITTSRADALIRQYLSPAASPNEVRQRKLSAVSGLIPQAAYPELDAMMDVAIRKVDTFLSGAPFKLLPRVVVHAGPGLATVPGPSSDYLQYCEKLTNQTEKVVGVCARYYGSRVVFLRTVEDLKDVLLAWQSVTSPGAKVLMVPAANSALARELFKQLALREYLPEAMLCWYPEKESDSFLRIRITSA